MKKAKEVDVRTVTILAVGGVGVLVFLAVFLGVVLAKRTHGGSLKEGFDRAREFVVFLLLSAQTAVGDCCCFVFVFFFGFSSCSSLRCSLF